MPKKRSHAASLPIVESNAAGIDVGATQIFVAVPADRDPESIRCFPTFTVDLERLADWLQECQIRTVAMESTVGVLDSSFSDPGETENPGVARQCASCQECSRAQDGRCRLSMDSALTRLRSAARIVSAE